MVFEWVIRSPTGLQLSGKTYGSMADALDQVKVAVQGWETVNVMNYSLARFTLEVTAHA